jgi:hypothetical protein
MSVRYHIVFETRHGSPYDRGMADSYYQRGRNPHYFKGDSYNSPRVTYKDMTPDEVVAYHAGYDDNEDAGDYKDWG